MERHCRGLSSSDPMGVKTAHVRYSCYRPITKRVTINVGGRKFIVKENVFEKFPYSLLGNLKNCSYYDKEKNEYFFDRDPDAFRYVLQYCQTGRLHVSDEECFTGLLDELDYFRIPTKGIYNSTCCEEETGFNIQQIIDKRNEQECGDKDVKDSRPLTTREKVWEFFSNEDSSYGAALYSNLIHIITILSTVLIAFETVSCDVNIKCGEAHADLIFIANSFCVAIFTIDYVVRFSSSPERFIFVRGFLNIVDLLALLPFYIAITLKYVFRIHDDFSFIAILRLFRVFRIIKLAKRSERLRTIGGSIFKGGGSGTEVFFVLFGLLMVLTVFSTIIFFMEQTNGETAFGSIPETMWYTAVTITSLGYGDMVPVTILGKFFGVMTLLVGFLGSSLLIPVVQMKFGNFSKKQL